MSDEIRPGSLSCLIAGAAFAVGLAVLAVRLKAVQVDSAADYNYRGTQQAERRILTSGVRGRILDRNGVALADNVSSVSVVLLAERFQRRTWTATAEEIRREIDRVAATVGRPSTVTDAGIARHLRQRLSCPLVVWKDLAPDELARFAERSDDFPGFALDETVERVYPNGSLAAHLIGHVGRGRGESQAGDARFNFFESELRGRAGLESFYDSYLRGMSGEDRALVDSRGYAIRRWPVVAAKRGPDLRTTIDTRLQAAVEEQLVGCRAACVVVDPRNGDVLAMASSPTFDLNGLVPVFTEARRKELLDDPLKPLLNRAAGGSYAPGSTFKPITALAALGEGLDAGEPYACTGTYEIGGMRIRCARTWGHGETDLRAALRDSCNTYFCSLGVRIGTNALVRAARAFGIGTRTGIDFVEDAPGVVPDGAWKQAKYGERWYPGDLAQMSMGQGMLLVSPLRMALVAGALGTGRMMRPRLNLGLPEDGFDLPFPSAHLAIVREGMRLVVEKGSGKRAAEGVSVKVAGKTGTAEVGAGANRRKNTWFIGYAPAEDPELAIALVVERGESGGSTAAPRVGAILRSRYGHVE